MPQTAQHVGEGGMSASAAPPVFPHEGHRTMAQVFEDEARGCNCELVELLGDAPGCEFAAAFQDDIA